MNSMPIDRATRGFGQVRSSGPKGNESFRLEIGRVFNPPSGDNDGGSKTAPYCTHGDFSAPWTWPSRRPTGPSHGFSLIELLIVIGLITVLVGGASLALQSGGNRSVALQSAQAELHALLGAARAQAVLHQTSVRLLIYATPPPDGDPAKYLRCVQIVREDPLGSGQWIAGDGPAYLPLGVFIVPPAVPVSHLIAGLSWPVGQFAPVSIMPGPAPLAVDGRNFGDAYYIEYQSDGRPDPTAIKLALATAQPPRDSFPHFDNPSAVRGIRLHPAGNISSISSAGDF